MEPKRCYGCMKIKTGSPFCEHCGYDERTPGASHHLRPGTVLREKYLVGRVLGQGGFGITYLGWDIDLNTPVAIKEYYPAGVVMRESTTSQTVSVVTGGEDTRFAENRNRFLREAQTLARLEDVPEVVQIKNFFSANNTAYIIMGYVKGITLKEHIRNRGGHLSVKECFDLLAPLMKAMEQVHALGLVHRDISPDNIMLQPNGRVRLIDFGAAHEASGYDGGKSTQAVLKHGFAPVEQYQGKGRLGPWTDVYAMCATIYYCLTGKLPPHATDRMMGEDTFDWDSIPGLTPQQNAALKRGVEVHYSYRTQSMGELYRGLLQGAAAPAQTGRETAQNRNGDMQWNNAPEAKRVQLVDIGAEAPDGGRRSSQGHAGGANTAAGGKRRRTGWIVAAAAVVCAAVIGFAVYAMRPSGTSLRDVTPGDRAGSAQEETTQVSIESDLTNLQLDGKTSGKTGSDYSATLIPEDGYLLPEEITVKVDGSELSDKKYAYDPESGELTIPGDEITGDIEIIAEAEAPALVGDWVGTIDMTDMFNEIIAGADPVMQEYFAFSDIYILLRVEFSEDGVCRLYVDSDSVSDLTVRLKEQLTNGTYDYLDATIAEGGLDMTVDELLASEGYTLESFIDETFNVEEMMSGFTDISETGNYAAENGMLYMSDSLNTAARSVDGNPYELDGNWLTIQGTGKESAEEEFLYPLVLTRVS